MWKKLVILALMVVFLLTMTSSVFGYDGSIPNRIDPGGEEHPWGGGLEATNNFVGLSTYRTYVPQITTNTYVNLAVQYYWIQITNIASQLFLPAEHVLKAEEIRAVSTTSPHILKGVRDK